MPDTATTITLIDACGRAGVAVLLMSDPGVGKSSMVRGLANSRGVPCETVFGSIREPADFNGLPIPRDDGVEMWAPAWARNLCQAGCGYLLLDELTTCPPAVQAAMLGVALERRVGDVRLPDGVSVIACANPPDRAADGWAITPALANRLCHVVFTPTEEEYIHGLTTGWASPPATRAIDAGSERRAASRAAVAGFLNRLPQLIHSYPKTEAEASGAWPSRRTWTMTAEVLARVRDDDQDARHAVVYGLVGEGAGNEFLAWLQVADLPDPADVLADPSSVNWKDRPDKVWAILAGVVAHCTAGKGSAQRWREAWGPLAAAADAGGFDVAAAVSTQLARARPAGALPPPAAKVFERVLGQAGLAGLRRPEPAAAEPEL